MRHPALTFLCGSILAVSATSSFADEIEYFRHTRYELLSPSSRSFRVIFHTSATTPGETRFFNIIRPGSAASNVAVFLESTKEELPYSVVSGTRARSAGHEGAREDASYIQIELPEPVPEDGETRLIILKTYTDADSYHETEESLLVFERSLTVARNEIALPPGYRVAHLDYPCQMMSEPDGRIVLSFVRDHPGPAEFRVEALPLAGSLWSLPGWRDGETTVQPDAVTATASPVLRAVPISREDGTIIYDLDDPDTAAFRVVRKITESQRLRIEETRTDGESYGFSRGHLFWWGELSEARSAVILPAGYTALDCTVPATISTTPDGRQRFDFRDPMAHGAHVVIRAREIDRAESFRAGDVPVPAYEIISGRQAERRDNMLRAMEDFYDKPEDEVALITYARTLAWYGRTRDSIDVYAHGLIMHPDSYRILRHRGHRYLSIRHFDDAVADLEKSAALLDRQWPDIEDVDDPKGHDASPREYLRAILYHLGVALYMARDLEAAERVLVRSMEVAANDDQRCASAYWLINTLIRLDRAEEIPAAVAFVKPDMQIEANLSYSELVLLHAGVRTLEETLDITDSSHSRYATLGYGVANWLRLNGREQEAIEVLQRILTTDAVMNFGFIGAEVQLHEEGRL